MKKSIAILAISITVIIFIVIKANNKGYEKGYEKGHFEGYIQGVSDERYASYWTDCVISCKALLQGSYENKICVRNCMRNLEVPEDIINKVVR